MGWAVVFESHGQDSRYNEMGEICETVTQKYGTGGCNTPIVVKIDDDDKREGIPGDGARMVERRGCGADDTDPDRGGGMLANVIVESLLIENDATIKTGGACASRSDGRD